MGRIGLSAYTNLLRTTEFSGLSGVDEVKRSFNSGGRLRFVVSPTPLPFYPWYPLVGGWRVPKPVWMYSVRDKSCVCRESNLGFLVLQPVA